MWVHHTQGRPHTHSRIIAYHLFYSKQHLGYCLLLVSRQNVERTIHSTRPSIASERVYDDGVCCSITGTLCIRWPGVRVTWFVRPSVRSFVDYVVITRTKLTIASEAFRHTFCCCCPSLALRSRLRRQRRRRRRRKRRSWPLGNFHLLIGTT